MLRQDALFELNLSPDGSIPGAVVMRTHSSHESHSIQWADAVEGPAGHSVPSAPGGWGIG